MSEQLFSLSHVKDKKVKRSVNNITGDGRAKIVLGALVVLGTLGIIWKSNKEFEKKLTIFPGAKFVAARTIFDRKENVKLKVNLGQRNPWTENIISLVNKSTVSAQTENDSPILRMNDLKITSQVTRSETGEIAGVPMTLAQTGPDEVTVTADSNNNRLKPGKYDLTLTIQRGNITQTIKQDFSWGVLAINTNKPAYKSNEEGLISFAVLDNNGNMVCDANLSFELTTPSGNKILATTDNGLINISDTCSEKSFVFKEDFYYNYTFKETGFYFMHLTAVTNNGTFDINDQVEVTNNLPFDIERYSSTRIFPALKYPVLIKVIPDSDFNGSVHERVPMSFDISDDNFGAYVPYFEAKGAAKSGIVPDTDFKILNEKTFKALEWNVKWKKGQTYYLYYSYDSPDKSPDLFITGPLKFVNSDSKKLMFSEAREWQIAVDAVSAVGWMVYADATLTPPAGGNPRIRKFTAPTTWAAEFTTQTGTTASRSLIAWVKVDAAPTREELMIGSEKVDGDFVVHAGSSAADATADFLYRWNNPGTTTTLDCDNTSPFVPWKCIRPFDIEYEQLSGRGMVVYGDNTMDRLYYALWNGRNWSPNTSPGTPNTTNQIDLPGSAGYPGWVVLKSAKPNLAKVRSDNMMMLAADTSSNLYAFYWNGSSWDSGTTLDTALGNCGLGQCFDGDWSDNNTFTVFYNDTTGTDISYRKYTIASGTWSTENVAFASSTNGVWVKSAPDPTSSRISIALTESGNDTRNALYRGDNVTENFTLCSATDCPDTTSEITDNQQASVAFQRWGGDHKYVYNDDGAGNSAYYFSVSAPGTWAAKTLIGTTAADDHLRIEAYGHPNNANIMYGIEDVDCDLNVRLWNGTALEGNVTDIEADIANYGITCPNATQPGNLPAGAGQDWDFVFSAYSPWSRNWRFFSDITSTAPSTGFAGQNTAPTDIAQNTVMRLRMNVAELANTSETDTRKVLQYTTGCDPNSAENTCTWTDVADTTDTLAPWRYATTGETCAGCADGSTSTLVRLSGSNQTSPQVFFVADKDNAASANFDHTALSVVEIDFPIVAQFPASYTWYYFRIYEPSLNKAGMDSPVFREQDNDNSYDCAGVTYCTYPSLKTGEIKLPPSQPSVSIDGGGGGMNFDGITFNQ